MGTFIFGDGKDINRDIDVFGESNDTRGSNDEGSIDVGTAHMNEIFNFDDAKDINEIPVSDMVANGTKMNRIKYLPFMAYKHTVNTLHKGNIYDLKISSDHPVFDDGDKVFVWIPPLTGIEQMVELTCRVDDSVTSCNSVYISEYVYDLLTGYNPDKGDIRIEILESHNVFVWNKYHMLLPQYEKDIDNFYPLCVLMDRYGGVYSNGKWTAWIDGIDYIPDGVFSDDVECMITWGKLQGERKEGKTIYGVGNTPEEALRDIVRAYKFRLSLFEKKNEDKDDNE